LLDEPTEGLAPVIVERIGEILIELKKRGLTVLLVEQNFRFAARVADRFYLMDHGTVVDSFATADLPHHQQRLNEVLGV
ncbi:MAG: ABC transporter ATP-binding protein, partial [Mesorhizobium sp.]|nr:ABC transporter ATP-binding protein [Mesorhizobium sp.]